MRFFIYCICILLSMLLWGEVFHADTPSQNISTSEKKTPPQGEKEGTRSIRELKKLPFPVRSFYEDGSIYRFVSRSTPLSSRFYIPEGLVSLSGTYIDEAGRKSLIRKDAKETLDTLAEDFYITFGEKLVVISAYRSAAYQQRLWDLGRCTDSLCAPPGHSEHQLGLAVDFFDASTASDFYTNSRYVRYVAWLKRYAHLYGWTQSYQKGEAIDEYEVEPWHWRYVGIEMATRLKNLGWTYTEYVRFQEALAKRY